MPAKPRQPVKPQPILPDWPAPANVGALATTRSGGHSAAPFDSLNLGDHVDDAPEKVAANRAELQNLLGETVDCQWLRQVHGTQVAELENAGEVAREVIEADASMTRTTGVACLVMTADCLPVLFCDRAGTVVAAAHAGWRGLVDGVLEQTINSMAVEPEQLMCWLGPAIGPQAFEIGPEVRAAFVAAQPEAEAAFELSDPTTERWLADIYQLARLRLNRTGITAIYGGGLCTHTDVERFFSYRRDGRTGRMASLVWLKN